MRLLRRLRRGSVFTGGIFGIHWKHPFILHKTWLTTNAAQSVWIVWDGGIPFPQDKRESYSLRIWERKSLVVRAKTDWRKNRWKERNREEMWKRDDRVETEGAHSWKPGYKKTNIKTCSEKKRGTSRCHRQRPPIYQQSIEQIWAIGVCGRSGETTGIGDSGLSSESADELALVKVVKLPD